MYNIVVKIEFEDGTKKEEIFEWWETATDWVCKFAFGDNSMPCKVEMQLIRK